MARIVENNVQVVCSRCESPCAWDDMAWVTMPVAITPTDRFTIGLCSACSDLFAVWVDGG